MVEQILKVVSRELSVVEVMKVFKGEVAPVERLQPCLYSWVREKLLEGAVPTPGRKQQAVEAFLANCKSTLEVHEVGAFSPLPSLPSPLPFHSLSSPPDATTTFSLCRPSSLCVTAILTSLAPCTRRCLASWRRPTTTSSQSTQRVSRHSATHTTPTPHPLGHQYVCVFVCMGR